MEKSIPPLRKNKADQSDISKEEKNAVDDDAVRNKEAARVAARKATRGKALVD